VGQNGITGEILGETCSGRTEVTRD